MKGLRIRFFMWTAAAVILFLLANTKLRPFPHVLLIFWLLLPILSAGFSFLSGRHIDRKEELRPLRLHRGEEGEWILELNNSSRWMPFFLHFPFPSEKHRTTEVMLRPGEVRRLHFPFIAPYTGTYTFSSGEPIFEDLLGFFKLQFGGRKIRTARCFALPAQHEAGEIPGGEPSDDDGNVIERRSLNVVTDDLFSIDPIQQGEPLSHTHWKLSSRLQKWMIKHYSDVERAPLRLLVDVKPVNFDGAAQFIGTKDTIDPALDKALRERTDFLDYFYTVALRLLEKGVSIDAGDRYSQLIHLQSIGEKESLAVWIATLSFNDAPRAWRLSQSDDRRQMIWVQEVDDATLGSLLQYQSLGIDFVLVLERSKQSAEILQALERSRLECLWLDEADAS